MDLIHNLAEQEAPLPCSPRLSVQVESLPESFGSIAGAISPSLFVQRWIAQQDPERAAVPLIISRVRWDAHRWDAKTARWIRPRQHLPRSRVRDLVSEITWVTQRFISPCSRSHLVVLIWLHHAIQRSLIDFGIELGF